MSKNNNTTTTLLVTILVVLSLGIAALVGHRLYEDYNNRNRLDIQWRNGEIHIEGSGCDFDRSCR